MAERSQGVPFSASEAVETSAPFGTWTRIAGGGLLLALVLLLWLSVVLLAHGPF
ncbi:hypothetical protein [Marinivivus vitaminiproducens]|uniref:hypothetical protein n=1 Tax=Marinivivus vitaminiproducens TaxID=3035935 RepID=UPI00279CDD03|nr:hypothetical protein P4R82_13920 [Geminicoccaceae bacterium SCSIO 64248]